MINNIQNSFSIQDLELMSGIKAHTIRIWEKRYGLLNPTRLNRNIRMYNLEDLQKLLNVSLLQKHNYKISELSKLGESALAKQAKQISLEKLPSTYYINSLLVSMFSLDDELFEETYQNQIKDVDFKELFVSTYLPLLNHIGVLWQTNGIKPTQEHFISNLIYQKIALNIASIEKTESDSKEVNILFLPEGEVHEIGLLYLQYCLKLNGKKTIYLGRDIPTEDLFDLKSQFQGVNWICSFIMNRTEEEKNAFVLQMNSLLEYTKNKCFIIGRIWSDFSSSETTENITFYESFDQVALN